MSAKTGQFDYWYCADCATGSENHLLGASDEEVEADRLEHNRLNHEPQTPDLPTTGRQS